MLKAVQAASDIDEQDQYGFTALMWAAMKADVQIVKAILLAGADVNLQSNDGSTALMLAAKYNQPEVVESILKHKADVDLQSNDGWTALMVAARCNRPEVVESILKHKPDVDLQNDYGWTALMAAARYNRPEAVEAILKHKPDVDLQDNGGWTALMDAAKYNQPEVAESILKHKADVDLQSDYGWTALMVAARYNQPEVVEAILKHKADVDLQTRTGATALFLAVLNQHGPDKAKAMIRALLRAGADVDLADFAGLTPLMKAVGRGRVAAVEALLQHGSLPELRSRSGQNALDFARLAPPGVLKNRLVQRLEEVTPKGMDLAKKYFASRTTWLFLGSGLAFGVGAGSCLVAMGKRGGPTSSEQVTVFISSRRLAIKSLTKHIWKAEAFRALELVACVLLPFSMTMLWIEPLKFLPFYFLVYTLPALACWQQKALRFPALLLVSPATRPGLLCRVRLPRAVATVAQLALLYWLPGHCSEPIRYYIYEATSLGNTTVAFPMNTMVHRPMLLMSRASAESLPGVQYLPGSGTIAVLLRAVHRGRRQLYLGFPRHDRHLLRFHAACYE